MSGPADHSRAGFLGAFETGMATLGGGKFFRNKQPIRGAATIEWVHGPRMGKQVGRGPSSEFAIQESKQAEAATRAIRSGNAPPEGSASAFTSSRAAGLGEQPKSALSRSAQPRARRHRFSTGGSRRVGLSSELLDGASIAGRVGLGIFDEEDADSVLVFGASGLTVRHSCSQ